eukprot:1413251-Rhodomonas_salina.1
MWCVTASRISYRSRHRRSRHVSTTDHVAGGHVTSRISYRSRRRGSRHVSAGGHDTGGHVTYQLQVTSQAVTS